MRKILKIHKKKPLYLKKVEHRIRTASSEKGSSVLNAVSESDGKLNREESESLNASTLSAESVSAESVCG